MYYLLRMTEQLLCNISNCQSVNHKSDRGAESWLQASDWAARHRIQAAACCMSRILCTDISWCAGFAEATGLQL